MNGRYGCDVLVVGRYYADLVFRGLAAPVRPGGEVFAADMDLVAGGAFTAAMALHRLGREVVWAADFGDDPFSGLVLAAARVEGLNETGFHRQPGPLRNVSAVLSYAGERAMVSYQDPAGERPLAALLLQFRPRVLFLPLLEFGARVKAALPVARSLGTWVFMDCQDVAASLDSPGLRDVLARVDVFAPNEAEALRLTGAVKLDAALQTLAGFGGTVVVKRGAAGASAVCDGVRRDVGAVAVEAVDTTGAGDCFDAGFVHARLAGMSLEDCLAVAIACGAAATTGPGSRNAVDAVGLQRWLSRVPQRCASTTWTDAPE